MRRALALIFLLGVALAAEVKIEAAERLFLTGDGEAVVLEGNPVVLVYKDRRIEAHRVTYFRKARRLLLEGGVRYTDPEGRTITARTLTLLLEDEALVALETTLEDDRIVFRAPEACRSQGQILLSQGLFSPCLACGQDPPDYAFSARKVVIYPGDRIVARDVWVELGGERAFYLPLFVFHTGPRRPRLALGYSETDGFSLEADLPYVTAGGLGFTLLRYFERRGWGLGFDHWGAGAAREHYRFLYLPPPVGETEGTIELLAEWALEAEGWKRSFTLKRDDRKVRGRFSLTASAEKTEKADPYVRFTLERVFDTAPDAPAPTGRFKNPEVELAWRKGVRWGPLFVTGRAVAGGYEAATNRQNRSARAAGPRIGAGRVLLEHRERLRPRLPKGFFLTGENAFSGYYYSTAEIQVNWKSSLKAGYRSGGLEAGVDLLRWVQEGETPFAFDRLPTRRKAHLAPYLKLRPNPLGFSISGGYEFFQKALLPLEAEGLFKAGALSAKLRYRRDLEAGRPLELRGEARYSPRPFSLSASVGYRFDEDRYDPLLLRAAYALPGGSAALSTRYDPKAGRFLLTQGSLAFRQGEKSASLRASYDHRREILAASGGLGLGPWRLSASLRYPRPDGVPEPEDGEEGTLTGRIGLAFRTHRLTLEGRLNGEGIERAGLTLATSGNTRKGRWDARARFHLPDRADPGVYLAELALKGGVELSPNLAVQGGLGYRRSDARETLAFQNFGLTLALSRGSSTRVYLSTFLNQSFDLRSGEAALLKPRFVFTYDRCCWALRYTIDPQKEEVRLSLVYGGQSADLALDDEGVLLPGGVRLP